MKLRMYYYFIVQQLCELVVGVDSYFFIDICPHPVY